MASENFVSQLYTDLGYMVGRNSVIELTHHCELEHASFPC